MSSKELIVGFCNELFPGIVQLIERSRQKAALFLNVESTLLYWSIGQYINENLKEKNRLEYGAKILATLSQQLSWSHLRAAELAKMNEKPKTDLK